MNTAKIRRNFLFILLAFLISSSTVILIPFSMGNDGNLNGLGYVAGILFWVGMIAGTLGYIRLYRSQRNIIIEENNGKKIPGAFRFFSNPPAMIMDVVLIISIVGTAYFTMNVTVSQAGSVIFLLLAVVSVYAHLLLNGRVYQYIWKHQNKDTSVVQDERKE